MSSNATTTPKVYRLYPSLHELILMLVATTGAVVVGVGVFVLNHAAHYGYTNYSQPPNRALANFAVLLIFLGALAALGTRIIGVVFNLIIRHSMTTASGALNTALLSGAFEVLCARVEMSEFQTGRIGPAPRPHWYFWGGLSTVMAVVFAGFAVLCLLAGFWRFMRRLLRSESRA